MTKENTKFNKVTEYLKSYQDNGQYFTTTIQLDFDQCKIIELALRLADRLTIEPSESLRDRLRNAQRDTLDTKYILEQVFDQLFKELDEVEK